jgi:hypothetical protein
LTLQETTCISSHRVLIVHVCECEGRTKYGEGLPHNDTIEGLWWEERVSKMEWLPFLHPVWQSLGIALGFAALREGIALRRGRRTRPPAKSRGAHRSRHVRLGKCSLWIIGSGYLLGLGELFLVRGEPILRSAHFYFATLALGLFGWGAMYGFAMLRGGSTSAQRRELHGFLLPLALLMMVGVGLLGLKLLP